MTNPLRISQNKLDANVVTQRYRDSEQWGYPEYRGIPNQCAPGLLGGLTTRWAHHQDAFSLSCTVQKRVGVREVAELTPQQSSFQSAPQSNRRTNCTAQGRTLGRQ
jgi:hypothetical protein